MNNEILIQLRYIKRYDFIDPRSGRSVRGSRFDYYPIDELENAVSDSNQRGVPSSTISGDYSLFDKIQDESVPGWFALQYEIKPDSTGKPQLVAKNLRILSNDEKEQIKKMREDLKQSRQIKQ